MEHASSYTSSTGDDDEPVTENASSNSEAIHVITACRTSSAADKDNWLEDDSSDNEEEEPQNGGSSSTLLNNINTAAQLKDQYVSVAPGEGNRPLGIILDRHFEEYAFPCMYGGEKLPTSRSISSNMLCRFQLRNHDRRAAANSSFIFLKLR